MFSILASFKEVTAMKSNRCCVVEFLDRQSARSAAEALDGGTVLIRGQRVRVRMEEGNSP